MNPIILIVEDDTDLRTFLEEALSEYNYTVYATDKASAALKMVDKIRPNLVILDLGLPDVSGDAICARIKESYPALPVIILTASSDTKDVISSFEKGADDYVQKPFKLEELAARIKAKLHVQKRDNPELKVGDLSLNTETLAVTKNNHEVTLTHTEFKLLHYLMVNANRVLTREQLLSHVWSQDPDIETRVVDVYIGYLRKKLDTDPKQRLIQSKRGFGYMLKAD
jgi:two-component system, OmpR family, response regulator